jgi:hypothetical protein
MRKRVNNFENDLKQIRHYKIQNTLWLCSGKSTNHAYDKIKKFQGHLVSDDRYDNIYTQKSLDLWTTDIT